MFIPPSPNLFSWKRAATCFLSSLLFSGFVGCLNASSEETSTPPITIAGGGRGLLNFDNGRIRCSFADRKEQNYDLNCQAVVIDAEGNEENATGLADGIFLNWQTPEKIAGAVLTSLTCQIDQSNLAQRCSLSLSSAAPTKIQVDLRISDRNSQREKVESETVLLPLTVKVFGHNVEIPIHYEPPAGEFQVGLSQKLGFQTARLNPKEEFFGPIEFVVRCGERIYFSVHSLIYVIATDWPSPNGKLYAGSTRAANFNETSHRLRFAFSENAAVEAPDSPDYRALRLACGRRPDELYVSDVYNHRIVRLTDEGPVQIIANAGKQPGSLGVGGPATVAQLDSPMGLAVTSDGSVLVADTGNHRICKIDPRGILTTIAGIGRALGGGDGGPARSAGLNIPEGLAVAEDGSIFVADTGNQRVRKVDPRGIITTVAGTGSDGFSGDGGLATRAMLKGPAGVAIAADGSVLVADRMNHRIRRIGPNGIIATVAGNGTDTILGDGGPALLAGLKFPQGLAVALDGSLLVPDPYGGRIRKVDPAGKISTITGVSAPRSSVSGERAVDANFRSIGIVTIAPDGTIFFVDSAAPHSIRKIDPKGILTTIAGSAVQGFSGDGGPAINATLNTPSGLAIGADGSLLVADTFNHRVRRIGTNGNISTLAGNGVDGFLGDGGPASLGQLNHPTGLAILADGSLLVADRFNFRIRRILPNGTLTTFAGNGEIGASGDGGLAVNAGLRQPHGIAVAADGSVFVTEPLNHVIRRISPVGIITRIAGNGLQGVAGDGGPALDASLWGPTQIAIDPEGRIYIPDPRNRRIRLLERDPASGGYVISTLVGAASKQDCGGGVIERKVAGNDVDRQVRISLDSVCVSQPFAISIRNNCSAREPSVALVFSQTSLRTSQSSLIEVKRPCL